MVLWGWSQVSDRHRISLFHFVTRTFSTYHILLRRLRQFNCEILNEGKFGKIGGKIGIGGDAGTNGGARGFREVFRVVLGDAWLREFVTFIAGMDVMSFEM